LIQKSATVSLREIAQETNTSITTVSRALRSRGDISEETRNKVLEVARRLRYRPNMLVKGLQTGKTFTMGVMVPPYDSYWTDVLRGIHEELNSEDYLFINTWCDRTVNGEDSYGRLLLAKLHQLIDRRVDGIILWANLAPYYNEHFMEDLEARDLPVVTIDHELPFADSVETDESLGASLAAGHLTESEHRYVGHIGWKQSYKWAQLRKEYFEKEIIKAGGQCISVSTDNDADVPGLTKKLIYENPQITAIYACSDRIASIVYDTLYQENIRIPDDISVVGFADLEFSKWLKPGLTTIRQDGFKTGETAAKLLIKLSKGQPADANVKRLRVKCELVVRESTCRVKKKFKNPDLISAGENRICKDNNRRIL
jgi:LacI family transcriptional regulator